MSRAPSLSALEEFKRHFDRDREKLFRLIEKLELEPFLSAALKEAAILHYVEGMVPAAQAQIIGEYHLLVTGLGFSEDGSSADDAEKLRRGMMALSQTTTKILRLNELGRRSFVKRMCLLAGILTCSSVKVMQEKQVIMEEFSSTGDELSQLESETLHALTLPPHEFAHQRTRDVVAIFDYESYVPRQTEGEPADGFTLIDLVYHLRTTHQKIEEESIKQAQRAADNLHQIHGLDMKKLNRYINEDKHGKRYSSLSDAEKAKIFQQVVTDFDLQEKFDVVQSFVSQEKTEKEVSAPVPPENARQPEILSEKFSQEAPEYLGSSTPLDSIGTSNLTSAAPLQFLLDTVVKPGGRYILDNAVKPGAAFVARPVVGWTVAATTHLLNAGALLSTISYHQGVGIRLRILVILLGYIGTAVAGITIGLPLAMKILGWSAAFGLDHIHLSLITVLLTIVCLNFAPETTRHAAWTAYDFASSATGTAYGYAANATSSVSGAASSVWNWGWGVEAPEAAGAAAAAAAGDAPKTSSYTQYFIDKINETLPLFEENPAQAFKQLQDITREVRLDLTALESLGGQYSEVLKGIRESIAEELSQQNQFRLQKDAFTNNLAVSSLPSVQFQVDKLTQQILDSEAKVLVQQALLKKTRSLGMVDHFSHQYSYLFKEGEMEDFANNLTTAYSTGEWWNIDLAYVAKTLWASLDFLNHPIRFLFVCFAKDMAEFALTQYPEMSAAVLSSAALGAIMVGLLNRFLMSRGYYVSEHRNGMPLGHHLYLLFVELVQAAFGFQIDRRIPRTHSAMDKYIPSLYGWMINAVFSDNKKGKKRTAGKKEKKKPVGGDPQSVEVGKKPAPPNQATMSDYVIWSMDAVNSGMICLAGLVLATTTIGLAITAQGDPEANLLDLLTEEGAAWDVMAPGLTVLSMGSHLGVFGALMKSEIPKEILQRSLHSTAIIIMWGVFFVRRSNENAIRGRNNARKRVSRLLEYISLATNTVFNVGMVMNIVCKCVNTFLENFVSPSDFEDALKISLTRKSRIPEEWLPEIARLQKVAKSVRAELDSKAAVSSPLKPTVFDIREISTLSLIRDPQHGSQRAIFYCQEAVYGTDVVGATADDFSLARNLGASAEFGDWATLMGETMKGFFREKMTEHEVDYTVRSISGLQIWIWRATDPKGTSLRYTYEVWLAYDTEYSPEAFTFMVPRFVTATQKGKSGVDFMFVGYLCLGGVRDLKDIKPGEEVRLPL